jgi:predicted O-methyltransferase YrrM
MKQIVNTASVAAPNGLSNADAHFNRPGLLEIVRQANGMLPAPVYEALWECAQQAPGTCFVEVGTAHGAATIALALGGQDAGLNVTVHTIDRLGGKFSSRARFGSVEENRAIVQKNFACARVAKCISLFVGSTDEFVASGRCPDRIDLLMLDADGRIDRDLLHFYNLLAPNAIIVIDDIDRGVYLGTTHDGTPYVDLKHRITSLLLAGLESQGFLRVEKTIHHTAFCRRGERKMDYQEFSGLALSCYRELVFADLPGQEWKELVQWHDRRAEVRRAIRLKGAIPAFVISIGRASRRLIPRK